MIARKIQQSKYSNLGEMEKDLIQMTKNACTFNEPGSQIYKDAKVLRKLIHAKKIEIEQGKFQSPNKASERIRSKRLRSGQSLSAVTAALKSEEEDDEEEDGGSVIEVEEPDNPCWQLYDCVKSTTVQGTYFYFIIYLFYFSLFLPNVAISGIKGGSPSGKESILA